MQLMKLLVVFSGKKNSTIYFNILTPATITSTVNTKYYTSGFPGPSNKCELDIYKF